MFFLTLSAVAVGCVSFLAARWNNVVAVKYNVAAAAAAAASTQWFTANNGKSMNFRDFTLCMYVYMRVSDFRRVARKEKQPHMHARTHRDVQPCRHHKQQQQQQQRQRKRWR